MYAYFKGTVAYKDSDSIVVDVNDIGYRIYTSSNNLDYCKEGESITLYTYTNVKEDAILLFGFKDKSELELFKLLISVSGIGPKIALGILSAADIDSVRMAIATQDVKMLSKMPGIGPKTAGRLVLELKDKISAVDLTEAFAKEVQSNKNDNQLLEMRKEAIEAMTENFGFEQSDVLKALNNVTIDEDTSLESLIGTLLGMLGKM